MHLRPAGLAIHVTGWPPNAQQLTPRHLYTHRGDFFDVAHGNHAVTGPAEQACGRDYLCVAKTGYDAPPAWELPTASPISEAAGYQK